MRPADAAMLEQQQFRAREREAKDARIRKMLSSGLTVSEVCQRLGCRDTRVDDARKRGGR